MPTKNERVVYWGTCERPGCLTTITVSPHPERLEALPLPNDAEEFWEHERPDCPVCGATIIFGGSDPVGTVRV